MKESILKTTLKKFYDAHANEGKYFNGLFKCESTDCSCGDINSPITIFREMKTDGILKPVISQMVEQKKYLSYEETKSHPKRKEERLPPNHDRVIEAPPFTLSTKRARFSVKCSDKNYGKSRVVFSETKPSEAEIERCVETIEESSYICGDRVDILRKFSVNEKIHC